MTFLSCSTLCDQSCFVICLMPATKKKRRQSNYFNKFTNIDKLMCNRIRKTFRTQSKRIPGLPLMMHTEDVICIVTSLELSSFSNNYVRSEQTNWTYLSDLACGRRIIVVRETTFSVSPQGYHASSAVTYFEVNGAVLVCIYSFFTVFFCRGMQFFQHSRVLLFARECARHALKTNTCSLCLMSEYDIISV